MQSFQKSPHLRPKISGKSEKYLRGGRMTRTKYFFDYRLTINTGYSPEKFKHGGGGWVSIWKCRISTVIEIIACGSSYIKLFIYLYNIYVYIMIKWYFLVFRVSGICKHVGSLLWYIEREIRLGHNLACTSKPKK